MSRNAISSTVIYPLLGSSLDLWFVRVSGHGLGNCFFTYFHAVVMAQSEGAAMVTPPWFSLKVGPLLRGSSSKRLYWRMFKPYPGEIHGLRKLWVLLRSHRTRAKHELGGSTAPVLVPGALNCVGSRRFTFSGLHPHVQVIRDRLLGIVKDPIPPNHRWGQGDYIAVHVRLGDFMVVADDTLLKKGEPNLRIPMAWYVSLVTALRNRYPGRPIYIFSDGDATSLRPLLERGATLYRSGSDMTDLLAMAGASIVVGSNSTYSHWAVFLGNMPSIWLATAVPVEKPSALEVPILFVPLDAVEPDLW